MLLIGYAVVNFDGSTPFPGFNALVPVLGAALIIVFAHGKTWVGRALSSPAPVLIGMISYSAYLWHQPLFAFARQRSLNEPGLPLMLSLTLLSLMLAWLSWRYVEQPFRKQGAFNRQQIFTSAGVASALFIALGLTGYLNAVFGDSHSEALLSIFDSVARHQGKTIVHSGLGGCLPLLGVDVASGNYGPGVCEALASREFEYVKAHRIHKVVLVARWTLYTDGDYGKKPMSKYFLISADNQERSRAASWAVFKQALETTVRAYRDIGSEVVIIAQVPQQLINPENLYYRLARDTSDSQTQKLQRVSELSVPVVTHEHLQRFTREVFGQASDSKQIGLITPDAAFCKNDQCLIGDMNSYYKDFNHLNAKGAGLLAGQISQIVAQ
ncbi:acyltransferase [Pseudomonas syringae group genomosp. 3]|uniref:Acyltransferase n=1 Tax=Pseudomonas syringae group genomosp. 3 TaxID=251701 RepID=A0A2K4W901_9PSED|nr:MULTISPECIES: acyltransferase family protein [Pseudomonas syringae group]SOS32322.1 acyltransferase [Pseudomonas syringae group genomosp. 3]SPF11317.1 acyltransferase [Pseudomonas syringae group genomosp. 3]